MGYATINCKKANIYIISIFLIISSLNNLFLLITHTNEIFIINIEINLITGSSTPKFFSANSLIPKIV